MQGTLFLYVVVTKGATILKLLSSLSSQRNSWLEHYEITKPATYENEPLLVGRNTFFILNFRLHVINGISALDL